jgi:ureidoacrylate peracid hydrolase
MKSDIVTYQPALLVIYVQNGFMSKGGSYDLLDMKISNYQYIIPKLKELISICRTYNVPMFYTQAVRESSGIDLLTKKHRILPKSQEERIKKDQFV